VTHGVCVRAALVDLSAMFVWLIPEEEIVWPPRSDDDGLNMDAVRVPVFPEEQQFAFNGQKHPVPFNICHIKKMGHKAVRAAGEQLIDLSMPMDKVPPPVVPAPPPAPAEVVVPADWVEVKEQLVYMQEHKLPVRLYCRFITSTGGGNVPMDDGARSGTYNSWKEELCEAAVTNVKLDSHASYHTMSVECQLSQPITVEHSTGVANGWLQDSFKSQYRHTRINERPDFGAGARQRRTVAYAAGDTLRLNWQKDSCGGCSAFGCRANCNHRGGGKSDVFLRIEPASTSWLPNPIHWILDTHSLGTQGGGSLRRLVEAHKAADGQQRETLVKTETETAAMKD
jgi:hypothetical protein